MQITTRIAQTLLGFIFVVFGLNGFLNFIPMPPMPDAAAGFFMPLIKTGYFLPFLKGVEIIIGLALIANVFVPLSLVIVTPIIIQIILFHIFLDISGLAMGIVLAIILIFLAYQNRAAYTALLTPKLIAN